MPLTIKVEGFQNYFWNDGDTTSYHLFADEGIYWLYVSDVHGCSGTDSIAITNGCDEDILVPNAFTPNGDGLNDIFLPIMVKNFHEYHMMIFNRWGEKVFESNNPSTGWNGIDNGLPGEVGVFLWTLDYSVEGGPKRTIQGTVTLLR